MGIKGSKRSSYAYLEFTSAAPVQGKYLMRTSGSQQKPVGSLIEYRFIITDSAGRTLETPKEEFLYMDNRFQWEKVSNGPLEVYYYSPTTRARAESILKAGADTVNRMGALLGITPAQPVRIVAYENYADLLPALTFRAEAWSREIRTTGEAYYEYRVLLMQASDSGAAGLARHEVTHMVVAEAIEGTSVNMPSWLNEGLAEYAQGGTDSYDTIINEAVTQNRLLALRQMQAMPGTRQDVVLFYTQARLVVRYLTETFGANKVGELFAAFRQRLEIDEALKKVYGFDQNGLDNAWRKSMGLPPLKLAPPVTPAPAPMPAPQPPTEQPKEPEPAPIAEQPKEPTKPLTPTRRGWGFGCAAPVTP